MHTQSMMSTHPTAADRGDSALQFAIDAAVDCAQACTACADACLAEEMVANYDAVRKLCVHELPKRCDRGAGVKVLAVVSVLAFVLHSQSNRSSARSRGSTTSSNYPYRKLITDAWLSPAWRGGDVLGSMKRSMKRSIAASRSRAALGRFLTSMRERVKSAQRHDPSWLNAKLYSEIGGPNVESHRIDR
jgi:hypothetical protein